MSFKIEEERKDEEVEEEFVEEDDIILDDSDDETGGRRLRKRPQVSKVRNYSQSIKCIVSKQCAIRCGKSGNEERKETW